MKKDVFAVVVAIFVVCTSYYGAVSFGVSPMEAGVFMFAIAFVVAGAFAFAFAVAFAIAFVVAGAVTVAVAVAVAAVDPGLIIASGAIVLAGAIMLTLSVRTPSIKFRWCLLLYYAEAVFVAAAIAGADQSILLASLGVFYGLSVLPKKVVLVAKSVATRRTSGYCLAE